MEPKIILKHIELFAGCGGMSLGLEAAGFELYLANELSPMAGETFSFNLMGEDLHDLAEKGGKAKNVLWLKSNYDEASLKNRLRENPFTFKNGKHSDLDATSELMGKLLIGNIDDLLKHLNENLPLCKKLQEEDIDLISGGPPCQSFSLAGRREKDNHKNSLPHSFARFAKIVNPKFVLLENVKGITSAFRVEGKKYYAWVEVAKDFSLQGFVPVCMMLNSKYFGIPQNRPRFILLAIRQDIHRKLLEANTDENTLKILKDSLGFFELVREHGNALDKVSKNNLKLYDIEKDLEYFNGQLLPSIVTNKESFIPSIDAIDDLTVDTVSPSIYVNRLNSLFRRPKNMTDAVIKNHETRSHGFNVKARFRWFQIASNLNGLAPQALKILSGQFNDADMNLIYEKIKGEQLLVNDKKGEKLIRINDRQSFINYIKSIQTKKHSQRAIKAHDPAPAQMTIPDDLCHYSSKQLRTLTVREMARFQSFPDWFVFCSKITTGGNQRSYETPQYTQVGNAVPPLLAYELGKTISMLLLTIKNGKGQN